MNFYFPNKLGWEKKNLNAWNVITWQASPRHIFILKLNADQKKAKQNFRTFYKYTSNELNYDLEYHLNDHVYQKNLTDLFCRAF